MKNVIYTLLIVIALSLGIASLILLSQTTQNSERFGELHNTMLVINAAAALVLLLLICVNFFRLVRDYRRNSPGVRLKARMVTAFTILVVAPLVIVFFVAVQFLNQGIDTWFDVGVEEGLSDALNLSRSVLDDNMQENLQETRDMAVALSSMTDNQIILTLERLRRNSDATEITVFGRGFRIVGTSSASPTSSLPVHPDGIAALELDRSGVYVELLPAENNRHEIHAAVALPMVLPGQEELTVHARFPIDTRIGILAESVQTSYTRYGELLFLREPLKYSFTLTLSMVVLLSFLAAVYGAFFFARRLTAPIGHLAAGMRAVSEGQFDTRLPIAPQDEIGVLIDSFNDMIHRLGQAREETRLSEQQVEAERADLAAILARLSTGVIALESDGRIRAANEAASAILNVDLATRTGDQLREIAQGAPLLEQFLTACQHHLDSGDTEWRDQIVLRGDSGRRVLTCASTAMPDEADAIGRYVIVFDDITALLQAQRDAAWGEVAKRLAHEIKNPLTPIQLSAERIRRRYLGKMAEEDAQVLDRATHTIVQQVIAMRDIVNAFSEYARSSEINISGFDLNKLVHEVAYLYRAHDHHPIIQLDTDDRLTYIEADAGHIRQLLHNLIRNALEATDETHEIRVTISTALLVEGHQQYAEIRVSDSGPGIDTETLEQVFEPYVTTKSKGTGLGLAIVKKLVEEHGGSVQADNIPDGGARIIIRIPLNLTAKDDGHDHHTAHPRHVNERA